MRFDNLEYWKVIWANHRIRICQGGGIFLFLIAQPRSNALFFLGFFTAMIGEAVRFWAAGHIHKGRELAQAGPYAMTRNPLYFGSFLMACGFALICTSPRRHWLSTLLIWAAVGATFRWLFPEQINLEEEQLAQAFGADY